MSFDKSRFILLGLGSETFSGYQFIKKQQPNAEFLAFDDKNAEKLPENWQNVLKNDKNILFFSKNDEFLAKCTEKLAKNEQNGDENNQNQATIIKSPGFPPSHQLLQNLMEQHKDSLKQSSVTQLFFEEITEMRNQQPELQVIGVTGTKGKSTTASAIAHVLQASGKRVYLGGNIGEPALETLERAQQEQESAQLAPIFVLELSSHQLAALPYSPDIAVIQNITPEHLDYYKDFSEYVEAKAQIIAHQNKENVVVFNSDLEMPTTLAHRSPAQKLSYNHGDLATLKTQLQERDVPVLTGPHNLQNVMPAVVIGRKFGMEDDAIFAALKTFRPLPHRLELVADKNGIQYYNDSLATTPEAVMAALDTFPDRPIILLAGGFDRSQNYTELAKKIISRPENAPVKILILFPTTGKQLADAVTAAAQEQNNGGLAKRTPAIHHVESMEHAATLANKIATANDVVLLSPAAASFNMFADYKDRGEQFAQAVQT